MSVFTRVERKQLEEFLAKYTLGALQHFSGITSGIENTNYFVTTEQGKYVLTLFEKLSPSEIPFFLDLTAFLAEHEIPCAHPVRDKSDNYLGTLKNKPAALVQRLRGKSVEAPEPEHCAAVGRNLAWLHVVGQGFRQQRANDRGPDWRQATARALNGRLSREDQTLLDTELAYQSECRYENLPQGIIHADLFRDNVLFEGHHLRGIIDFYYACTDKLLYDLAVTLNDWCSEADGSLNLPRSRQLLQAYHAERPLTPEEQAAWPALLRAASLRFWLSRLYDAHFPRAGEITHTKDPNVFKNILCDRIKHAASLRTLWPEKS